MPLDTVSANHGARGSPHRLEHGPLLDVKLEIGARLSIVECLTRLGHTGQIDAVLREHTHEPRAVAIHQGAHAVGHETSTRRRRPQQASRKTRALFVGEVYD